MEEPAPSNSRWKGLMLMRFSIYSRSKASSSSGVLSVTAVRRMVKAKAGAHLCTCGNVPRQQRRIISGDKYTRR